MAEITREEAINSIIEETIGTSIKIEFNLDLFFAKSLEEARDIAKTMVKPFKFEDLAVNKYKEIEAERQRLKKLKYHELIEEGEKLGLWKQITKQKRLI